MLLRDERSRGGGKPAPCSHRSPAHCSQRGARATTETQGNKRYVCIYNNNKLNKCFLSNHLKENKNGMVSSEAGIPGIPRSHSHPGLPLPEEHPAPGAVSFLSLGLSSAKPGLPAPPPHLPQRPCPVLPAGRWRRAAETGDWGAPWLSDPVPRDRGPWRPQAGQFPKQLLRHCAPPGSQPASRGRDGAPRQARTPQGRSGDEELRGV